MNVIFSSFRLVSGAELISIPNPVNFPSVSLCGGNTGAVEVAGEPLWKLDGSITPSVVGVVETGAVVETEVDVVWIG